MRFFHLADLHIGKTVNGFSMLEDQRHIFEQVLAHARRERPDAVVLAGDIYDKSAPSSEAVALYDDFLTELAALGAPVLAVAGNHDSPERLAFAGRLLRSSGVHTYAVFDGAPHIVTLRDAWGEVDFHLLPFLRPATARRFFGDVPIDSTAAAVGAALAAAPPQGGRRHVLVAHQFVVANGAEPERSESETEPVGGTGGIEASVFDAYHYVALGHLHGPQQVLRPAVRYAGSPLKYSFSEHRQKKGVTLVELNANGDVETQLLPLVPRRDLRKIRGPLAQLTDPEVLAAENPQDYLHVTLTDERQVDDAIGRLRAVYPQVMELQFDNAGSRAVLDMEAEADIENKSSLELLEDFFAAQNGRPLDEGQSELANAALKKAEEHL